MEFITSDLHFGHKNIYGLDGFCPRTRGHFKTLEEMNEYLIEAHNSVVGKKDTTYFLGDFSLHMDRNEALEILKAMNGQFHFIKGNHDNRSLINYLKANNYKISEGMDKFIVYDVGTIVKRNGNIYYLTHYPLQLGERRQLRSLCGHLHDEAVNLPYSLNVGIDSSELPESHPFGVPLEFSVACELVEKKAKKSKDSDK